MNKNIVTPSISFLPMEDIAAELKSDKINRGFLTKEDKASDVKQVADIDANLIAVAISEEDRTTVNNALRLNGKDASEYITKEQGKKISDISTLMSTIYASEIQNIRDDMQQTKTALVKNGFIKDNNSYEGYFDAFKRDDIKYDNYICGISTSIVGNTNELFISDLSTLRYFEPGKKFIIRRTDLNQDIVVESKEATETGKITFAPSVNILDSIDNVLLYKTNGQYIRNSFSFSSTKNNVTDSTQERYFMQTDDTRTTLLNINKSNTGYGVCFKVPNYAAGAITKMSIKGKATGNPGALICYILKKESIYNDDYTLNVKFKNIEEAEEKGYLIAKSQTIVSSEAVNENELFFNFYDTNTGTYPILDGERYVFIIQSLYGSDKDYWSIRFSYFENNEHEIQDLQLYNKSYIYEDVSNEDDGLAIKTINNIDKYDLFFAIISRKVTDEEEFGAQEGLYTTSIVLPNPMLASQVRTTMQINKEGLYYTDEYSDDYLTFSLKKVNDSSYSVNDSRFKEGDTIIIGNQICTVQTVSSNQIHLKEPAYIDPRLLKYYTSTIFNTETNQYENIVRIPIYRMNYDLYVKPYKINWDEWDEDKKEFKTIALSDTIPLKLKSVFPCGNKNDIRNSDKLLFEADFGETEDIKNYANYFEIGIHWHSPYSEVEINDFKDVDNHNYKELIGRINNLVINFNRGY